MRSYGNSSGEYSAALEGAGVVDLAERGVLEASGPKRLEFLQGMLSNDLGGKKAGQGCRAALMSAKGHLRFFLRALVQEKTILLETNRSQLEQLQQSLELYRVAAPVRFKPVPTAILAVVGMAAAQTLRDLGLEPPLGPGDHVRGTLAGVETLMARAGDLPGGGFTLYVAPDQAVTLWRALVKKNVRPVGREALDARRVEDLRPWYGLDVTEENLLHETGLLAEYHSPTKGCYVGQEVVARLEARGGHVNKALRRVRLSAPAARGAVVRTVGEDGGKDVGRITTAAASPRFGPVAMAWVHRSAFEPGTDLDVDDARATVVADFEGE